MVTPVHGKDMLVKIDDGANGLIEVPHQGDSTFNTGNTSQTSVQKNSKIPFNVEAGSTVNFTIRKERPALAIHTRLRTLAATGQAVPGEYADKNSGGESYTGDVTVTMGEESAGTEGLLEQQVTLSFVDDPVVGVTP